MGFDIDFLNFVCSNSITPHKSNLLGTIWNKANYTM